MNFRIIIIILLILIPNSIRAAEFLVYAKTHWMELVPQKEKDNWDQAMWDGYDRRLVKGNPIVVKPNGWIWGKLERPPSFVVIKVPDMTVKEGEKYLKPAKDLAAQPDPKSGEQPTLYRKRYQFLKNDIDTAAGLDQSISVTKAIFIGKLTDRQ